MRDIKFRVWSEYLKEMRYDILNLGNFAKNIWKWMQYTELKDKNGKEIYEGDIIKFQDIRDDKWYQGHIYFSKGSFRIQAEKRFQPLLTDGNECAWEGSFEIIGNRFENPELLNLGEKGK